MHRFCNNLHVLACLCPLLHVAGGEPIGVFCSGGRGKQACKLLHNRCIHCDAWADITGRSELSFLLSPADIYDVTFFEDVVSGLVQGPYCLPFLSFSF